MNESAVTCVELLNEVVPGLSRLAVIINVSDTVANLIAGVKQAAQGLSLDVQVLDVRSAADLDNAFAPATEWGANGHFVTGATILTPALRRTLDLAAQSRLPGVYDLHDHAEAGGLMSYAPDAHAVFRRAAVYVDRILNGANPAEMPVERATTFKLLVNTKTAQALGLTIPPNVVTQVTWVQ
jgi:putative ABC transport system substrate-binding protein